MTRDYKNARRNTDRPLPGWIWLLTGLTIGLSVALLVHLNQPRTSPAERQAAANVSQPARGEASAQRQNPSRPAERRFDFYTLLPELEVVVPEEEVQSRPAAPSGAPTPAPTPAAGPYVLQAGSFQRAQEADSLKANLALLGVEADIQKVTVDRNIWHRVRVGPYEDLTELNRVRERLARNRIDTVLLKERR